MEVTLKGAVNCTVCHLKGALMLFGQNEFNANSVNKTTSSVSLQNCAQYRLQHSVCVTSDSLRHLTLILLMWRIR
jgi:hypothetical protein